jgi:gamma-glutamyltranspeptidase/glutathione hydrolase
MLPIAENRLKLSGSRREAAMNYVPPPHTTQHWLVTKPAASGKRGTVVSQARGAAEAGIAVLDAGGNAIDAAVATALALAAVEPWNSGLGGIGFALVHRAGQPTAEVMDFGPVAPHRLSPANFKLTGAMSDGLFAWPAVEGDTNIHGPLSFAIPSSVAGYHKLHESWGRLPLAEVIAPAIALARRGLPRDWFTAIKIATTAPLLRHYAESARIYLPDGLPRAPAQSGPTRFFRLGRLADTLEHLQHAGLRDYYEGDIAASIAADIAAMGGVLDGEDLRHCQARILPATQVPWRNGRTLQLATGLTAAPTMANVLNRMRDVPYGTAPDAAWYATFARIMKGAYAERLAGLGEAEPKAAESCTTHLTVCDSEGTMVAMTTTLLSTMGSCVVLPESGVLLNNGVMWFDPRPGQPNSIAPGKRPLNNMCPIIMREDDRPVLAGGASGGRRIMGAVFQMMSYVADFGMDPQQAAHQPRIDVSSPDEVTLDRRLPADVQNALAADGPTIAAEHAASPALFACPNLIVQAADGTRHGISDAMSPWSAALAQQ